MKLSFEGNRISSIKITLEPRSLPEASLSVLRSLKHEAFTPSGSLRAGYKAESAIPMNVLVDALENHFTGKTLEYVSYYLREILVEEMMWDLDSQHRALEIIMQEKSAASLV